MFYGTATIFGYLGTAVDMNESQEILMSLETSPDEACYLSWVAGKTRNGFVIVNVMGEVDWIGPASQEIGRGIVLKQ